MPQTRMRHAEIATRIEQAVNHVIRGKSDVVRLLLTALFSRGHVLIEDVPGVGKTTIARTLATCLGGTFRRIQFTSDLLPSDILGVSIYHSDTHAFEFKRGPIFANVVLADEINRTTPRTQSALMEALSEAQISMDAHTHLLEQPFFVIATQNPVEHYGTYPLPESQMDRFLLRVSMGYPAFEDERKIITDHQRNQQTSAASAVVGLDEVIAMQNRVDDIVMDPALLDYALSIVHGTRQHPDLTLGASTRAAVAWYRAAKAYAMLAGRTHVIPDDLKQLAVPVLAHRLILSGSANNQPQQRSEAERLLRDLIEKTPVPL